MADRCYLLQDLKAENETQLRMKDLHYSNRLAELDEKYTHEVNSLKRVCKQWFISVGPPHMI